LSRDIHGNYLKKVNTTLDSIIVLWVIKFVRIIDLVLIFGIKTTYGLEIAGGTGTGTGTGLFLAGFAFFITIGIISFMSKIASSEDRMLAWSHILRWVADIH
jgi:hypothetical protein